MSWYSLIQINAVARIKCISQRNRATALVKWKLNISNYYKVCHISIPHTLNP